MPGRMNLKGKVVLFDATLHPGGRGLPMVRQPGPALIFAPEA